MVGAVAFFATYEIYKNKMLMLRAKKPDEMDSVSILTAGSLAGAAYVIISHPFETVAGIFITHCNLHVNTIWLLIHVRFMVIFPISTVLLQVDDPLQPRYKGSIDCAIKVLRQNGIQHGLYKGMGPTLLRAFPSYAAAFYGYEYGLQGYYWAAKKWGGKTSQL